MTRIPSVMDKSTIAKVEAVRRQTPRYLFRLWADGDKPSGGRRDLNTFEGITPRGFADGRQGHRSAYHLTKDEFTTMIVDHLRGRHIPTEFSSWTSSLRFLLCKCPGIGSGNKKYRERDVELLYISVIDVEMLERTNQAFYVPLLQFLSEYWSFDYEYEFLVHGPVKGRWHQAIPFSHVEKWFRSSESNVLSDLTGICSERVTEASVQNARDFGLIFNDDFALPIALMALSCGRHGKHAWAKSVPKEDLDVIMDGLRGLKVPKSFKKRHFITDGTSDSTDVLEVKASAQLLQAAIKRLQRRRSPTQMSK